MMPTKRERVKRYNRSKQNEYIHWLVNEAGIEYCDTFRHKTRESIDMHVASLIPLKPSWVEAAEEVLGTVEEEEEEGMIVPEIFVPQDYNSWTVKELQEECKERGLTIRGSKAEVVLRLRRDDEGIQIVEQETEDETEAPSEEAAEVELDAPSEESEAVTEEVTDNDENSGETGHTDEEE